jgi:hypothetical protein
MLTIRLLSFSKLKVMKWFGLICVMGVVFCLAYPAQAARLFVSSAASSSALVAGQAQPTQPPIFSGAEPYPAPTQAASPKNITTYPGLTMLVHPAFDGNFKNGDWLPVLVQLENQGNDLSAEVTVSVTDGRGTTTYAVPVQLPTGSRKLVTVYVLPNTYSQEIVVQLSSGQTVYAGEKVQVNSQPNNVFLVGLVTPQRGTLSLISAVVLSQQNRSIVLVDVPLADLPERPEGLGSFNVLIINNIDTTSLSTAQQSTLESWVRQGGRLVVGGGAQAMQVATGLPASLLPIRLNNMTELSDLSGLAAYAGGDEVRVPGPFVVSTGEATGGTILAQQDNLPLVREWAVDNGFVDSIALDLEASPFDAWSGTIGFWTALLSPNSKFPDNLPVDISVRQMRANGLVYALSNMPTLDLPSIRWLAILLIFYVILIGPVNYLVLRWRKKLQLAWVTIPLITLAFSGGAFGVGYAMRGTDVIMNKIAIIEPQPSGSAEVSSYMGLFSPERRTYEIQVSGGGLLSPMNQDYDPWSGMPVTSIGQTTFVQSDPGIVRGLNVNQWSMQSFMTEGTWQNFGGVTSDLQFQGETLSGTVRNDTAYKINGAALILGTQIYKLGDLAPGDTKTVSMNVATLIDQLFGSPISYKLFQEYFDQPLPNGPPREIQLKQNILDNLFQGGSSFGPMFSSKAPTLDMASLSRLVILGWVDEAPPDISVSGRQPAQITTGLLLQPLKYRFANGDHISLPPGFVPGTIIELNDGGYCGPTGMPAVYLGRQRVVFEFQIPGFGDQTTDISLQPSAIESLILNIGSDGGSSQAPTIAFYDYTISDWRVMQTPIMGRNIITDVAGLVNEKGQVQVSLLLDNPNSGGGCFYLTMGLEATP